MGNEIKKIIDEETRNPHRYFEACNYPLEKSPLPEIFIYEKEFADTIGDMVRKMMKEMYRRTDKAVFDFLKARGFHPKNTAKYYRDLQKRLHRKGLKLHLKMIPPKLGYPCDGKINIEQDIEIYIAYEESK